MKVHLDVRAGKVKDARDGKIQQWEYEIPCPGVASTTEPGKLSDQPG